MSSVSTCKTRKERRPVARDEDAVRQESRTRRTKSVGRGGVHPPLAMHCQSEMRDTEARDGKCSWCIGEFRGTQRKLATADWSTLRDGWEFVWRNKLRARALFFWRHQVRCGPQPCHPIFVNPDCFNNSRYIWHAVPAEYRTIGQDCGALDWMLPQAHTPEESSIVLLDWFSDHLTDEVAAKVKDK